MAKPNRDPTQTTTIRKMFLREVARRYRALWASLRDEVVTPSGLGLVPVGQRGGAYNSPQSESGVVANVDYTPAGEMVYATEAGRVLVGGAVEKNLGVPLAWSDQFVESAHKQGMRRANQELRKALPDVRGMDENQGSFGQSFLLPVQKADLEALQAKTWTHLRDVNEELSVKLSSTLSNGLLDGLHPDKIAKNMQKDLALSEVRSERIARTEIVRSHHAANYREYERAGVSGVVFSVEWQATNGERTCEECAHLDGQIFKLEDVRFAIPVHPNCRCAMIPHIDPYAPVGQGGDGEADFYRDFWLPKPDLKPLGPTIPNPISPISTARRTVKPPPPKRAKRVPKAPEPPPAPVPTPKAPEPPQPSPVPRRTPEQIAARRQALFDKDKAERAALEKPVPVAKKMAKGPEGVSYEPIKVDGITNVKQADEIIKGIDADLAKAVNELNFRAQTKVTSMEEALAIYRNADAGTPLKSLAEDVLGHHARRHTVNMRRIDVMTMRERKAVCDAIAEKRTSAHSPENWPEHMKKSKLDRYKAEVSSALQEFPIDLVEGMAKNGMSFDEGVGVARSFYYSGEQRIVIGSFGDKPLALRHEIAHCADNAFSRYGGLGSKNWRDSALLPRGEKLGKDVEKWYYSKTANRAIGTYTNGDGAYYLGDWVNVYEGRIYAGGDGHEWLTMNLQRFYMQNTKIGTQEWAASKKAYPEFTSWIEKTFTKKRMGDPALPWGKVPSKAAEARIIAKETERVAKAKAALEKALADKQATAAAKHKAVQPKPKALPDAKTPYSFTPGKKGDIDKLPLFDKEYKGGKVARSDAVFKKSVAGEYGDNAAGQAVRATLEEANFAIVGEEFNMDLLDPFIKRTTMDPSSLTSTQAHLNIGQMKKLIAGGDIDPVEVYKLNGNYFVMDGHNRAAAQMAMGVKKIKVVVTDLDAALKSQGIKTVFKTPIATVQAPTAKAPAMPKPKTPRK